MNRIEIEYEQHAVIISCNGIDGSGCIIQPTNEDYSLVFTAKHCLTPDGHVDKGDIMISRSKNTLEVSFNVENVFLDSELDIAIIQVSRIPAIKNTLFTKSEKELPVSLFGYPHLLNGASQILSCKVSFNHSTYSDVELTQTPVTFDKSGPDTIKGFSGSAIFHEEEGKLAVVGILTKLKAQDGAYNNICAYHIDVFNELLISKGLPCLFDGDNFDNIIQDYSFSFTNYNTALEKHYLQRLVDEEFDRILMSPKNSWISGESGVGKTLLINRNLKIKSKNYIPIDLTTSSLDDIVEYFKVINREIIRQKDLNNASETDNIYDDIAFNLNQINNKETLFIYVDEVPIKDVNIFSEFLAGFIKISEKYSNTSNGNNQIKWIISTRINPDAFIKNLDDCLINKEKALKHFVFKPLDFWTNEDMNLLIELLEKNLSFSVSSSTKIKMIAISKGIPNPIKRVIELVLLDKEDIESAIEIVKTEHI